MRRGRWSPATGGGIKLAFELGRRSAQLIADHLQDMGAPPPVALAPELLGFAAKKLMRTALDMAPPNPLIDLALALPPDALAGATCSISTGAAARA